MRRASATGRGRLVAGAGHVGRRRLQLGRNPRSFARLYDLNNRSPDNRAVGVLEWPAHRNGDRDRSADKLRAAARAPSPRGPHRRRRG